MPEATPGTWRLWNPQCIQIWFFGRTSGSCHSSTHVSGVSNFIVVLFSKSFCIAYHCNGHEKTNRIYFLSWCYNAMRGWTISLKHLLRHSTSQRYADFNQGTTKLHVSPASVHSALMPHESICPWVLSSTISIPQLHIVKVPTCREFDV